MSHCLKSSDRQWLLELLAELRDLREPEAFGSAVARGLFAHIPCDLAGWNEMELASHRIVRACIAPALGKEVFHLAPILAELLPQHPLSAMTDRLVKEGIQDPFKLSDFRSTREFEETALYREAYRALNARHQIFCSVAVAGGFMIDLTISRQDRDFDGREMATVALLNRALGVLWRQNIAPNRPDILMAEHISKLEAHPDSGIVEIDPSLQQAVRCPPAANRLLSSFFPGAKTPGKAVQAFLAQVRKHHLRKNARSDGSSFWQSDLTQFILRNGYQDLIVSCLWNATTEGNHKCLLSPHTASAVAHRTADLTDRERDVFEWITKGKTNGEIAMILGVTLKTVEKHAGNIYRKLGFSGRNELLCNLLEHG